MIKNKIDFTIRNYDRFLWRFSWSFYSASSSGFSLEAKTFALASVTGHRLLNIQKAQLAVKRFGEVYSLPLKSRKIIGLATPIMI